MTQLMIDIAQETPEGLRLAAKFLSDHAALREAMERSDQPLALNTAPVPAGTSLPPVPPPPSSNVIPLVPPAPGGATPIAPAAPPAPSALPVVSTLSVVVSPATTTPGALKTDAYDDTGMPHDLRIHQKGMSKKKDGSWKVQKGLDPALVIAVTQELQVAGRMRAPTNTSAQQPNPATLFGQTPLPAGASAPVALPPGPQNAQIPPPPPPFQNQGAQGGQESNQTQGYQGTQVVPPPPPVSLPGGSAVPVPPPPGVGVPNAGQSNVVPIVSEFRALMDKLTKARTAGKLSADQINSAVQQAGAPSLQMLSSMSHLVPTVDALIDALLIMA